MRTTRSHLKVRWVRRRVALFPLDWGEILFKFWMWERELAPLSGFRSDFLNLLRCMSGPRWVRCFVTTRGINKYMVGVTRIRTAGGRDHVWCHSEPRSAPATFKPHLVKISQETLKNLKLSTCHVVSAYRTIGVRCHIYTTLCARDVVWHLQ